MGERHMEKQGSMGADPRGKQRYMGERHREKQGYMGQTPREKQGYME